MKSLPFTSEQAEEIRRDYESDVRVTALMKKWRCDYNKIIAAIRDAGGVIVKKKSYSLDAGHPFHLASEESRNRRTVLKGEKLDLAVFMYRSGESSGEIAKAVGASESGVLSALNRAGVKRRKVTRRYKCDESAFDDVSGSPVGQYLVGLLMTDGCISIQKHSKLVTLGLSGDDGEHLKVLADYLKSTHKINGYRNDGTFKNAKIAYRLNIVSERLVEALARYGVVPRKSLNERVIHLEQSKWFWAGAICGDGSVVYTGRGQAMLSLIGGEVFVGQFADFVYSSIGFRPKVHTRMASGNLKATRPVSSTTVGGLKAANMVKLLFDESPFAMPRKLETARLICSMYCLTDASRGVYV